MKIGIIGSGKFGLVLASIAMENNNEVVYSHVANKKLIQLIQIKKACQAFT